MTIYHGNCIKDFAINLQRNSRYGIKALFATPNIELARLYALHDFRQTYRNSGGFIYSFEIEDNQFNTIDYAGQLSYSAQFRQLIYDCSRTSEILMIKNVIDFPHKSMRQFQLSDIVVIYNLSRIKSISLIEENITTFF